MRIACPSCSAAYDVAADRLKPGRPVKCARCGERWTPVAAVDAEPEIAPLPERVPEPIAARMPEPIEAVVPAEPEPQPEPPPSPPAPPLRAIEPAAVRQRVFEPPPDDAVAVSEPGRSRAPVVLAWLLSLVLLAGLAWLGVTRRAAVMAAWPPSERAYTLLGLR